ncbi:MAG: ferrochelatase [Micropruina sp.]|nr:ferrochelatase [Micropruina sp.]HBX80150.1 ferrochelatase [Propionibacteriaceae bacterium]
MTDGRSAVTYDAILLLGFGGPESLAEVRPFLERVTAGRRIPPERLDEVGQHYVLLGGVSPLNAQNRALRDALAAAFAELGIEVPVILANRNSPPFVADVLDSLAADGHQRVLAVATSAYTSYSSCRQYREDVGVALAAGHGVALDVVKVPPFAEQGWFADAVADLVAPVLSEPGRRPFVLATTHSIPSSMARTSGPESEWPAVDSPEPGRYVRQHLAVAESALTTAAARAGVPVPPWRLVYQSRSGSPATPWLEPDINEALTELAAQGVADVVVVPIGFLSDHVEVIWDLDTQAAQTAHRLGQRFTRVATVGTNPRFIHSFTQYVAPFLTSSSARGPGPGEMCFGACCPPPSRPGAAVSLPPTMEGIRP